MAVATLFLVGIAVAAFVGVNIGGSSTGVLLFIGVGILLGNVLKMSTSTSQTAVAAVVGMGAAIGVLDWRTVGVVAVWWVLSTFLAFWVCAFLGRYLYDSVVDVLDFESRESNRLAEALVVGIGCYMAFSAGASNVANAVGPLVGSGQLTMTTGVALGGLAIGVGAFTLGRRTMETVGEDITDLSLEAALVVGYLLRIWEKMSIYERILQEAVSEEAEEQVADEVASEIEDQVPDEGEEHVADEVDEQVEEEVHDRIVDEIGDLDEQIDDRIEERIDDERLQADGDAE